MGYKRKNTEYMFKNFAGAEGFEVTLRSMSMGEITSFLKNKELFSKLTSEDDDNKAGQAEESVKLLAKYIISWNLEDEDDNPLPATEEVLNTLEVTLVMDILNTWLEVLMQVPENLKKK